MGLLIGQNLPRDLLDAVDLGAHHRVGNLVVDLPDLPENVVLPGGGLLGGLLLDGRGLPLGLGGVVAHLGQVQLALGQIQIPRGQDALGQHPPQVLAKLADGHAEGGRHGGQGDLPVGPNIGQIVQVTLAAPPLIDTGGQHTDASGHEHQTGDDGDEQRVLKLTQEDRSHAGQGAQSENSGEYAARDNEPRAAPGLFPGLLPSAVRLVPGVGLVLLLPGLRLLLLLLLGGAAVLVTIGAAGGAAGGRVLPLLLGAAGGLVDAVRRLTGGVRPPLGRVGGLLEEAGRRVPGPLGGLFGLLLVPPLVAGRHFAQLAQQPEDGKELEREGYSQQQDGEDDPLRDVVGVFGRLLTAGRGGPPAGAVAVIIFVVIGAVFL